MTAERNAHLIQLWLDNDEGLYLHVRELAQQYSVETGDLADALKDFVEELCITDDMQAGIAMDLLGAALSSVDWYSMACEYSDREQES